MSFSDELKAEAESAIKAKQDAIKVTAINLFSGVIFRTPVGNPDDWQSAPPAGYTGGSARSNWFLSFNAPSTATTEGNPRKNGGRSQFYAEMAMEIERKTSSQYLLTNNLPYINRLDENWSTQTVGLGIIAPELSRVRGLVPEIERAANRKHGVN